nr:hypothetical protein [Tanacetum cinerariifolium]
MCFKAFTISTDVPEIFMQQFWYTIKKVQGTNSYEFFLANKKYVVNADVFRIILDICPRVEGVDFTDAPNGDTTLTFLIVLGYKDPLYKLKFVRIGEDHQEYGLPIPDTMLIEAIKQSKTYQMFIKYSNGQIPPKKSRGKRSQGKKTTHLADVDVSEESDLKPAKKKTASRRVVKKKVIIFAEDNIIPELDIALELGKSISQIEAKKAEAAKKVHATHARIMTEPEVADTIKALKESRKCIRRQPGTGGSSEGTGTIPGVLDESTVVSATSEDQLDEEKDDKDGDAIDEGDDHISDTQDADDEDAEIESDEDEIYKYKIRVCKDEDEDMLNAKVVESEKRCSSLSVSSGFGDQFIKLSSDSSLVSTVKDSTDAEINSLLEVKIQSEVPHIQSPSVLKVHVSVIPKPSVLTPVQESPSAALGVADTVQDHKKKHDGDDDDDDEDPPGGPKQASSKVSKTGKSTSAKAQVEEPIAKVIMDDADDDVDPFTFNDLMATPIDFSKYVLNGLKIDNLTQDILLGPAFNLLKVTCSSSIELEYNFQECFNALTDKLDWNNPEGDW